MANFGISTGRSRRHQQTVPELPFRTRFGAGPLQPAPATPSSPPCPHGDLTTASAEHILKITRREWHTIRVTLRERIAGVRIVLGYLAGFAGDDWQQRWQASARTAAASRRRSDTTPTPDSKGQFNKVVAGLRHQV